MRPPRGTRPPNRRALILAAGGDLFARRGYADVSMGDIATAVAIGPSALYRHFTSKEHLLDAVVGDATDRAEQVVAEVESADLGEVAGALADLALAHRNSGVLWRRESRRLDTDHRREHQLRYERIVAALASTIHHHRRNLDTSGADLVARASLAVATSVSFHRLTLPDPQFRSLLVELVGAALTSEVCEPLADGRIEQGLRTQSRREEILTRAVELFATHGFGGVSMDDIGAAVGIAGPSLYNHFASKSRILAAALFRGDEWLRLDLNRALGHTGDPRLSMAGLVGAYSGFAFANPHLLRILVTEAHHLPEPEYGQTRTAQHTYISEWVHLLRQVRPELDPIPARIRVQAAQILINDIAVDYHDFGRDHGAAPTATALATTILGLPARTEEVTLAPYRRND